MFYQIKNIILITFIILSNVVFANKVYVILSSDTSIWTNTSGGDVAYTYNNEFNYAVFTNPNGVYKGVFDETFRNAHKDSLGNPFKFSWFMHGGGWFQKGKNSTAISTLFHIRKYWGIDLQKWGDEIAYHFHHFKWTGAQWAQADKFSDTIWDFDWAMSQMIIDESTYCVSFRSGWNYMDNEYQQYLEKWIPFRLEAEGWMTDCTPYHPSYTDYRVSGTMKGWEVRHYYMKNFTSSVANQIFNVAHQGKEQVVCVWSHQNEADFIQQIATVDQNLHTAATNYPDVQFLYCTAREAMNKWLKSTDTSPPLLSLETEKTSDIMTVKINTEPDIYQIQPWVAVRKYNGEYTRFDTQKLNEQQWQFSYSTTAVDRVVVAVSDIYGNTSLAEVQDGSRRWPTQSEFFHSSTQNIDIETSVNQCILSPAPGKICIEQLNSDSQTEILRRAYWIGQTFIPQSTGISKVIFGAKIIQPTQFRVELRETPLSIFPDDNQSGLLAFATATIDNTGTSSATLNYNGLQTDGRTYFLIFKLISGNAEIQLSTQNPYSNGMVIRAYSLDWITIPDFDCLFQIFDESGNLSINQPIFNSDAFASERGYFVSQTFLSNCSTITGLEIKVTECQYNETISIQLRATTPDSSPDYSYQSMIYKTNFSISAPGIQYIPLNWTIPDFFIPTPLSLTFVAPTESKNSIRLAYDSHNFFSYGSLFFSDDLVSFEKLENSDLYFKIFGESRNYSTTGTITMNYDAGDKVFWKSAKIETGNIPLETSIKSRFKFADNLEELNIAQWSEYYEQPHINFLSPYQSQLIQAQILLESSGQETPVFKALEVFNTIDSTPSFPSILISF